MKCKYCKKEIKRLICYYKCNPCDSFCFAREKAKRRLREKAKPRKNKQNDLDYYKKWLQNSQEQ